MFWSKLFGKKKPEAPPKFPLPDLPALNAWGVFFQGNGLSLYNRFAKHLPNGTEAIYLKSYPEMPLLERCLFGDWIYPANKGVYLQRLENDGKSALVFIDYEAFEANVITTGIEGIDWAAGYEEGKPVINFGNGVIEKLKD
jgi:hypothetical protein